MSPVKRNYFITYSVALSVISFALGFLFSALVRETRHAIHWMIGDAPLPWSTTVSLSTPPVFYLLAAVFLVIAAISILRPVSVASLLHAFIITLIAEAAALFVVLGGVAFFFINRDYAMSSTLK